MRRSWVLVVAVGLGLALLAQGSSAQQGISGVSSKPAQKVIPSYETLLREGYAAGKTLEVIQAEARRLGVKEEEFARAREYYLEKALALENRDTSFYEARRATNYQIAQELIQARRLRIAIAKGPVARGYDSVDRFVRDVLPGISTVEALTGHVEDLSREVFERAMEMEPDAFKVWMEGQIEEVAKEGIFTSNTLPAMRKLEKAVNLGGVDPMKGGRIFLSAIQLMITAQVLYYIASFLRARTINFMVARRRYTENDKGRALDRIRSAAESGDSDAQLKLGIMLRNGSNVIQNFTEAVYWIRLAAVKGETAAHLYLAQAYSIGQGVPQDPITAHMWANIAAANGNIAAAALRDAIAASMTPADLSEAQRRARECLASNYARCD